MKRFLKTAALCVGLLVTPLGLLGLNTIAPANETTAYYVGYFFGFGVSSALLYGLPMAIIIWSVATLVRNSSSNAAREMQ